MGVEFSAKTWWRGSDHQWHRPEDHPDRLDTRIEESGFPTNESTRMVDGYLQTVVTLRRATIFQRIFLVGMAVLLISPFLPWCYFGTHSYSFFAVDDIIVLPIAVVATCGTGLFLGFTRVNSIKRVGLVVGVTVVILNIVGWVVAARFRSISPTSSSGLASSTNDHVITALFTHPGWGGVVAIIVSLALIVLSLCQWKETMTVRGPRVDIRDIDQTPQEPEHPLDVSLPSMDEVLVRRPAPIADADQPAAAPVVTEEPAPHLPTPRR